MVGCWLVVDWVLWCWVLEMVWLWVCWWRPWLTPHPVFDVSRFARRALRSISGMYSMFSASPLSIVSLFLCIICDTSSNCDIYNSPMIGGEFMMEHSPDIIIDPAPRPCVPIAFTHTHPASFVGPDHHHSQAPCLHPPSCPRRRWRRRSTPRACAQLAWWCGGVVVGVCVHPALTVAPCLACVGSGARAVGWV